MARQTRKHFAPSQDPGAPTQLELDLGDEHRRLSMAPRAPVTPGNPRPAAGAGVPGVLAEIMQDPQWQGRRIAAATTRPRSPSNVLIGRAKT